MNATPTLLPRVTRVGFIVLGVLPWILPIARAKLPLGRAGELLDLFFAPMCHRIPARTLYFDGVPMPLCSRCAGIFAGLALGALIMRPRFELARWRIIVGVSTALMIADVVTQDLGVHPIWHVTRVVTGLLFGYAIGAACLLAMRRSTGEESPLADR
jgi:uncharacterized membrane protein